MNKCIQIYVIQQKMRINKIIINKCYRCLFFTSILVPKNLSSWDKWRPVNETRHTIGDFCLFSLQTIVSS